MTTNLFEICDNFVGMKEINKLLTNRSSLNEILRLNYKAVLIIGFIIFGEKEFSRNDMTDEFNKWFNLHHPEQIPKRDLDNEIRRNTIGIGKKDNQLWFEKHENKNYSITKKGELDAIKFIEEIENLIKEKPITIQDEIIKGQGTDLTIENIVHNIKSGTVAKIPTFQREYVWKTEKIAPLIFSLIRNYPIGSLLIWKYDESSENYIILDGLQRTFSLTRISSRPFAYINYDILLWFTKEFLNKKPSISKNEFKSLNEKWLSIPEEDLTEEKMIKIFNYEIEVIKLIQYLKLKWNSIYKNMKIPTIELDHTFSRDDSSNIFNLINSQGIELNKYEKYSSIWSKTPIKIKTELPEKHFIIKWKSNKEEEYRSKIGIKKVNVLEDKKDDEIEPSDFIYSLFQEASKNAPIIQNSFFKDEKLRTSALESVMTIFMSFYDLDYSKNEDIEKIGILFRKRVKTKENIQNIKNKLTKAIKQVDSSLSLLKNVSSNSKDGTSIKLASSIMSLLINIALNKKVENSEILYTFIIEYFSGNYTTSSTSTAWNRYVKYNDYEVSEKIAEERIVKYIDDKFNETKIDKVHDQKASLITSLFRSRFILGESKNNYQVDHIIPRSIFHQENNGTSLRYPKNHINSIYNLQLLDSEVNNKKNTKIWPGKKDYYLSYKLGTSIENFDKFKIEFDKHLMNIRETIPKNEDTPLSEDCKRRAIKSESDYSSFESFINFQKKYMRELIIKNGLLSENDIVKVKFETK